MRAGGHPDRHKRPRRRKPVAPRPHGAFTGKPQEFFAPACGCFPSILLEADGLPVPCCGARPVLFMARSTSEALKDLGEFRETAVAA